nr:transposase [uncultured Prevotella sp.]
MNFPIQVQRCIYTTNWIERLNRKYKRTIKKSSDNLRECS